MTMPIMHGGLYMKCRGIECSAEESAAYRELFDKREAAAREGKRATQISESPAVCRHLTDTPLDKETCGCAGKWSYPCDVYGVCTPVAYKAGVKRCHACPHYAPIGSDKPEPEPRRLLLVNECCPGDVLVMSAAIESLHAAYPGEFITAYDGTAPEIFEHNPHVAPAVSEIDGESVAWQRLEMRYPLIDHCDARPVHFLHGYCEYLATKIGKPVPLVTNRPRLYFSPEETTWLPQVYEGRDDRPRYWLINAGYKDDYPAKWWGTSNFQRVVDILKGFVTFVQIGEAGHNHPSLSGVIDMRGKTDTRQFLRMVRNSAGGVGPSTFLQHACAACEKPYVCIAGGREPLAWQHYPRQATLSTIGVTQCSASRRGASCWKDRVLPNPEKPDSSFCELPVISGAGEWLPGCLSSIKPERVAEEIALRYNNSAAFS